MKGLYLLLFRNGNIHYAVDVKEDLVRGLIETGTIYTDPPGGLLSVFETGSHDRWPLFN